MEFTLLVTLVFISLCESAKILYLMPFSAKSHYISQKDLTLELARRGHEVYVFTAHRDETAPKNYHHVMVRNDSIWTTLFDKRPNIFSLTEGSYSFFMDLLYRSGYVFTDYVFTSPDVQKFMAEDHKFDVVISELFFQEPLYMFAHKYQAPLVLLTTFGNSFKANYYSRNPLQLSTVFHEYGSSPEPLSFTGRLKNFYFCMYDLLYLKLVYFPRQEEFVRKYFKELPQPVPSLEEMAASAALVLMNSHFSIDAPAAYLPNFVEVGGLHREETNKTLPKDLQKILEDSKAGVIYFNFGSNVASSELSEDRLEAFLKVFGELRQTVLMKWETDDLPEAPKNVIFRKWFPQKDVLAHPNVKLFISHGGMIGLLEAASSGVPVIGVPVFGDQYLNVLNAVENGFGELLEHKNINEQNVRHLVQKVLKDDKFSRNAKIVAARFKDRPMNGIDTAVWWIEYVIRHKGADFMKSPGSKLAFYEYYNLDVYFVILGVILGVFYLLSKLFSLLKIFLCTKRSRFSKKKKL